jgi:hypothetical protein
MVLDLLKAVAICHKLKNPSLTYKLAQLLKTSILLYY